MCEFCNPRANEKDENGCTREGKMTRVKSFTLYAIQSQIKRWNYRELLRITKP